jgi:hypothetical protein
MITSPPFSSHLLSLQIICECHISLFSLCCTKLGLIGLSRTVCKVFGAELYRSAVCYRLARGSQNTSKETRGHRDVEGKRQKRSDKTVSEKDRDRDIRDAETEKKTQNGE